MKSLGGSFYLAPMAGFSDESFRALCRRQGAALSFTEMVSAKGLHYSKPESNHAAKSLLRILERDGPVGVQLFGNDPKMLAEAVSMLKDGPAVIFDINMGCPVPKVVKNGEGSALLRTPDIAAACVEAAVKAAGGKPVTVKMRIGFSSGDGFSAAEFAKRMEGAGASAITVHGRTREQYYSGKANLDAVKSVKDAVSVPVIGNGDIFNAKDGLDMLQYTGCDAAMVARGALGNPWIFRELNALLLGTKPPPRPDVAEIINTVMEQLELTAEDKGEYTALREMRKHAGFYTKGLRGSSELRARINTAQTIDQFREILDGLR